MISTIVFFVIVIALDRAILKKILGCIVIFLMCSFPAFGLLIHINSFVNIGHSEEYEIGVLVGGDLKSENNFGQVSILIEPWQYNKKTSTLLISKEVNRGLNDNSKIKLTVQKGLLGVRWITYNGQFQFWDNIKYLLN